jgi:hypothetical protein
MDIVHPAGDTAMKRRGLFELGLQSYSRNDNVWNTLLAFRHMPEKRLARSCEIIRNGGFTRRERT